MTTPRSPAAPCAGFATYYSLGVCDDPDNIIGGQDVNCNWLSTYARQHRKAGRKKGKKSKKREKKRPEQLMIYHRVFPGSTTASVGGDVVEHLFGDLFELRVRADIICHARINM